MSKDMDRLRKKIAASKVSDEANKAYIEKISKEASRAAASDYPQWIRAIEGATSYSSSSSDVIADARTGELPGRENGLLWGSRFRIYKLNGLRRAHRDYFVEAYV